MESVITELPWLVLLYGFLFIFLCKTCMARPSKVVRPSKKIFLRKICISFYIVRPSKKNRRSFTYMLYLALI